jgi:pimeloyl-ACP methyl ester carboxylesterase
MLMEGRAIVEAGQLLVMLPLLRLHARKGAGEPVMVLPGFMADDRSTVLLRHFLQSIGYTVFPWGLGINRKPMAEYLPVLRTMATEIHNDTGHQLKMVGWSRGGILSRELARDCPDLVDRVVTIGSPVKGGIAASSIGRWVQRETGLTPAQMARLTEERYSTPIRVPVRAIFSRTDGVVAWRACVDDQTSDISHFQVEGSHIGLGTNAEVYRLLPRLLSNDE